MSPRKKKEKNNSRLMINEQTVLLMLANKSKEEIETLERTEEMKKMLTCYRKARAIGTTRGITKMSRVTLLQELLETMDIEQSGEINYTNIN